MREGGGKGQKEKGGEKNRKNRRNMITNPSQV